MLTIKSTRFYAAVIIIVIVLFVITLNLMGRIWWCDCGFGLWTMSAWSNSTSQNLGDPYSFSHILHGIIFYAALHLAARRLPAGWKFIIAVLLEVAWEIAENSPVIINRYRTVTAALDYYGDSILNSLGDVLSMSFGFWIAYKYKWQISLLVFIAIELIMLALIYDNLTLNVLMLLYPINAIRDWQMKMLG